MRQLNPAETCWEAGEVYPWCLSTCRSPAWELSSRAGEGRMDGSGRGAPYPGVFAGKKKKKNLPREPDQKAWSRAAWLCTHHTVDLLSG